MTALAIRDERHYLATVAEVRALAERIEHITDARELADKARAAEVWARRARLGQQQVDLAVVARLWAERRAGELLREIRGDAGRLPNGTIPERNISPKESHKWQELAEIPAEDFQAAIDEAVDQGSVSRAKVMQVHYSSATDDWATPQDLFDLLNQEFDFDLDVCASDENAKCQTYYTAQEDGLAQPWVGTCWMNPPYGRVIGDWVRKAWDSSRNGATVVCLVPARVDTGWWWDYCRFGEIRFLRGRLKFGGGDMGAPFPSAVVVFGPRRSGVVWWERWQTV